MLCKTGKLVVATLDSSFEASFIVNTDGNIFHKNVPAENLFENEEADDESWETALTTFVDFSDHEGKSWEDVCAGLSTAAPSRHDATGYKDDGTAFPVSVSLRKLEACPCCGSIYICAYVRPDDADRDKEWRLLKRTQATVDASFDAMLQINESGVILMANDAATKLLGWAREEFVGKNISMICGGGHAQQHDEYLQRYLKTGIAKIMGKKREVLAKKKDGSEICVELGISEIKLDDTTSSGESERVFCGFINDLSSEKKHERELIHKESLTQGMVNASFDPMFQIDQRGKIWVVNDAAVSMFGWTREEFLGKNISMICGGGHGERHDEYLARYLKTGERHIIGTRRPIPAKRKDGSEFTIELGISEVQSLNGERMFCGYLHTGTSLQNRNGVKTKKNPRFKIKGKFFQGEKVKPKGSNKDPVPM